MLIKCKKVNLTHLMSVDDLLMFCKANVSSVSRLFDTFQVFSRASRLNANSTKSCVCILGVLLVLKTIS